MSRSDDPDGWLEVVDRTETGVHRGPRRPRSARTWIGFGFVVVIVAAIAWMVARAPTAGLSGLADDLAGPTTTVMDGGIGSDDDGATSAENSGSAVPSELGELDAALADYRLFASRSSELIEIDLATEEVRTYPIAGRLIGYFDDRLLLVDPDGDVVAVPVDDPDAETETVLIVEPEESEVASAVVDDDGILHVTVTDPSADPFASTMVRLDLTTGAEQRVEVPTIGSMGLVEVPGGGLFELTGDGFRSLTDASVRFFGLSHVLVEQCDDPEECTRFWLLRSAGVRITRPLPELEVGYVIGRNGRVAVGVAPGEVGFFDVRLVTEIPVEDPYRDVDDPWFVVEDLTADDRFLAAVVGDVGSDVVIHDLDTGGEARLEFGRSSPLTKVLFVPGVGGR